MLYEIEYRFIGVCLMHPISKKTTRREAFEEGMEQDENIFIIGEEAKVSGGTSGTTAGLQKHFGDHRVGKHQSLKLNLRPDASYNGL